MEITVLTDEHIGLKVSCVIERIEIEEAVIIKSDGRFYICQNVQDGSCPYYDTTEELKTILQGYRYSWVISNPSDLTFNSVRNVMPLDKKRLSSTAIQYIFKIKNKINNNNNNKQKSLL